MVLTLNDMKVVGLCVSTQELFDTKRFQMNYCDTLILRDDNVELKNKLRFVKRELNSFKGQEKFLNGYKVIIVNNIERIISLVASRYAKGNIVLSSKIVGEGKSMIGAILKAQTFDDIGQLEGEFKSRIMLPTYELFLRDLKKTKEQVI